MICPTCRQECQYQLQPKRNHIRYHCTDHDCSFVCHTFDDKIFSFTIFAFQKKLCFNFVSDFWGIDSFKNDDTIFKTITQGNGPISPSEAYQLLQKYLKLLAFI